MSLIRPSFLALQIEDRRAGQHRVLDDPGGCAADLFWPVLGSAANASIAAQRSTAVQAGSETTQRAFITHPPTIVSIVLEKRH